MENFFMNTNNNPEEVEWVDEQVHASDVVLENETVETHEEVSVVTPVVEPTPVDNTEVVIYALRNLTVPEIGLISSGYTSLSQSHYEKIKHIKAIRLAKPDEIAKFRK